MNKYGYIANLKASGGNGNQLASILIKASEILSQNKQCDHYLISHAKDDKDSLWITEIWSSKQAHDEALQNDEVRALIGQAMPLLAEPPSGGTELEVLGGIGL